jgi:hypothetical protein
VLEWSFMVDLIGLFVRFGGGDFGSVAVDGWGW